ncbi:DNA polymerase III, clamp loader complex, gamma/delta/delta subunit [Cunninghamella echinulata]|nr:DNA polymerase III, clamp loader complex, gamma/delta/delta subunit [Cunninghamella echinulata]
MSSDDKKVNCPICGKSVSEDIINTHLDSNCAVIEDMSSATKLASIFTSPKSQQEVKKISISPSQPVKRAPLFENKTTKQYEYEQLDRKQDTTKKSDNIKADFPASKRQRLDPTSIAMPLAAKVRPNTLEDIIGQEELVGKDGILNKLIKVDRIPSMILWGYPGTGKTTLARIISKTTKSRFIELSATSHGASDVRKAFDEAKGHLALTGQRTIVFIDEIHRFTKAQQDLFLPYVESGQIRLIGATTENPSFKVNSALLSRCRVFVLKQLTTDHITMILANALFKWRYQETNNNYLESNNKDGNNDEQKTGDDLISQLDQSEKDAIIFLANFSDGDARSALNTLEIALNTLPSKQSLLNVDSIKGAFQKSHLLYDRNGEEHYNLISALHKSIRGGDADAALYWLVRMLESGEDPLYIGRRLIRMASEDIGLADNTALPLTVAAYHGTEKVGMPECKVILAQAAVYLAETKKSVRVYKAYNKISSIIQEEPNHPVPLHIRNAPTTLMKNLGYGKDYMYNPDYKDGEAEQQTYLPDALIGRKFLEDDNE